MNLRQEGQDAESLTADFLVRQSYRILERNYRINLGEIDIIAQDGDTICFIEVKMRRSSRFGGPFDAVAPMKMQKLVQVAWHYLKARRMDGVKARFDVVAVTPAAGDFKFDLLKNAFGLDEVRGYY